MPWSDVRLTVCHMRFFNSHGATSYYVVTLDLAVKVRTVIPKNKQKIANNVARYLQIRFCYATPLETAEIVVVRGS